MHLSKVNLLGLVRSTIAKYDMLRAGETVVVGVSGGADSVACLHLLCELKELALNVVAAHVNHGLRGQESKRDADFVEALAREKGLECELFEADAAGYASDQGLSLEEAGRVIRYGFFAQISEKYSGAKIATAHTFDDQAETVLMRLIRGSGPKGLAGIPPVGKGGVIRPLIEARKSDLKIYLNERGAQWLEDSTNLNPNFLRNRIRHELIPVLERYNPSIKQKLVNTSSISTACWDYIEQAAEQSLGDMFDALQPGELCGDAATYSPLHRAVRYAVLMLGVERVKGNTKRIGFEHICAMDDFLLGDTTSGEIDLPDGIALVKSYGVFMITTLEDLERSFSYTVPSPGRWSFPYVECEITEGATDTDFSRRDTAVLDASSVGFPIEIKSCEQGMRFHPLGMEGTKKLKRFFIDAKVPRFFRRRVPLFLSGGEIVWVGGMRVDERFKLRGKAALTIRLISPKIPQLPWAAQR